MEKTSVFLNRREAVRAIIADFRQYEPQTLLFTGIIHLITGNRIHFKREPGKAGVWVTQAGSPHMKWLNEPQIVSFVCNEIAQTHWNPELLAETCARVFQTRAYAETHPATGEAGVRIETNMEGFICRQCGFCCRFLDYENEITDADVDFWKAHGRQDILKWVRETVRTGKIRGYRVWFDPVTGRQTETCPFLQKKPEKNQWNCTIHDAKPAICRQFPLSRKHARMTGCRGFNKIR